VAGKQIDRVQVLAALVPTADLASDSSGSESESENESGEDAGAAGQ